jgi:hypothetical protein
MIKSKSKAMSHSIHGWERLLSAVAAHADDLQHVAECREQLEAELADLCATRIRRNALVVEKQKATQDLSRLRERVEDLASRLRSGLLLRYGLHSDMLGEFGIKPARRRKPKGGRFRMRPKATGAPIESHRTVK